IPTGPINVVTQDSKNADVLYVGTDVGVYVTLDGGETWSTLAADLPSTFVSDLALHPTEDILVASTHGRGVYAMDVRPLQDVAGSGQMSLYLDQPESVRRPSGFRFTNGSAKLLFYTSSPTSVMLNIKDAIGTVVFSRTANSHIGFNVVEWDLKATGSESAVPAGTYSVEVNGNGSSSTATLEKQNRLLGVHSLARPLAGPRNTSLYVFLAPNNLRILYIDNNRIVFKE
ncbi:hypothetical protein HQ496_00655, partial [bacterium]|nr:hypothetical protein [bacterium]